MTAEKRDAIQSVSVSNFVKIAPNAAFNGRAGAWGVGIGGAIGAAIAANNSSPSQEIKAFLDQKQIDVRDIVRNSFFKGLANDPKWASRLHDQSDTYFNLEVLAYGLTMTTNIFSSDYKPWLSVRATLMNQKGETLWQAHDVIAQFNSATPKATYADFLSDPKWFLDGFSAASAEITQSLLDKLNN